MWADCADNIIHVDRYHFFPRGCNSDEKSATSYLHCGGDETAASGQLEIITRVLTDVHTKFYEQAATCSPDVRSILGGMRAQILAGCHIAFSKVRLVARIGAVRYKVCGTSSSTLAGTCGGGG